MDWASESATLTDESKPTPSAVEPELTILILCRNEVEAIAHCVGEAREFLERNAISGEVAVVDNGSVDRSAERAAGAGARVIAAPQPGYGNAVRAGIATARGQFIILGDGDGEHDLNALEAFWEQLQAGYDLVMGNRYAEPAEAGARPFLNRYVGAPLLSGIGRLFSNAPVTDFHCGLRGFRAASLRSLELQSSGSELTSEMVVKAMRRNLSITEVPATQRRALDPERVPHLRIWSDGWQHLRLLLLLTPRWLFLYPASVLLAVGAFFMATSALYPEARFGAYTMLYGAVFIICGTQLIGFTLLANVFYETVGLSAGGLTEKVQQYRILESGLAVGFTLALAGVAGSVWSLFLWAPDVDVAERLRVAIPSITLLVMAVQVMFAGFLLALIAGQPKSGGGGGGGVNLRGSVARRSGWAGGLAPAY